LEGSFEKPDEILVSLGLDYFAQYTAKEAVSVAERRSQMVDQLLTSLEDEIEIKGLTQKLKLFDTKDEGETSNWDDETAVDIREEWSAEDEVAFASKGKAHVPVKATPITAKSQVQQPAQPKKPVITAIKEKVVERKPSRPKDPMATALPKQARESMFRKQMRKDAASSDQNPNETLSPGE
jgi:hypothetical protein